MALLLPATTSPSGRTKKPWQIYTTKARENATNKHYYIKVEPGKTGNLHLTGALNMFKSKPTMIYNPSWRLAGKPEDILAFVAFQNGDADAADSPLRGINGADVVANAYKASNFVQYRDSIDAEMKAYEVYKNTVAARDNITLEDASALLRASGGLAGIRAMKLPGPVGAAGGKKRARGKAKETFRTKVEQLIASNNTNPIFAQVFDVVKLTDKGTGARKQYLRTVPKGHGPVLGVNRYYDIGLPIASTLDVAGRAAYYKAIQQLAAQGMDATALQVYMANFDTALSQAAPLLAAAPMQVQPAVIPTLGRPQTIVQPGQGGPFLQPMGV